MRYGVCLLERGTRLENEPGTFTWILLDLRSCASATGVAVGERCVDCAATAGFSVCVRERIHIAP
jgi:hypothetical protein